MNCHACGNIVNIGEGATALCMGYMEVSLVLIHNTEECRNYQLTHHCNEEPQPIEIGNKEE